MAKIVLSTGYAFRARNALRRKARAAGEMGPISSYALCLLVEELLSQNPNTKMAAIFEQVKLNAKGTKIEKLVTSTKGHKTVERAYYAFKDTLPYQAFKKLQERAESVQDSDNLRPVRDIFLFGP